MSISQGEVIYEQQKHILTLTHDVQRTYATPSITEMMHESFLMCWLKAGHAVDDIGDKFERGIVRAPGSEGIKSLVRLACSADPHRFRLGLLLLHALIYCSSQAKVSTGLQRKTSRKGPAKARH